MMILINNVDRTQLITNLRVDENITNQVSVAYFNLRKYGDRTFTPAINQSIEIFDGEDKIFTGAIQKVDEAMEGVSAINYTIECASSAFEFDNIIVAKAYEDMTIAEIIAEMTELFAPDFTTNNVESEQHVDSIVFNNVTFSEAMRRLAKIVNYQWYVDVDNDIHFFPKFSELAPYDLTDSSGNYIYKSLVRRIDGTQIVNKVIVRGGEYDGAEFTDQITVVGNTTSTFDLPYKFANLVVELDTGAGFVAQSVGIDFINSFDDYDVLYNFQEKILKWENALSDGDVIRFTGNPKLGVSAVRTNSSSISMFGLREKIIRDRAIRDNDTAGQRAQAELDVYATSIQDIDFTTYTPGLRSGMVINLTSTERDCDTDLIIKSVSYQPIDPNNFGYKVKCVTTQKYELLDLLRQILEPKVEADDQEIAELLESIDEDISVSETISIVEPELIEEDVLVEEEIADDPLGAGVSPVWVWGYHHPTSLTDEKRMLYWSSEANPNGGVWEEINIDYVSVAHLGSPYFTLFTQMSGVFAFASNYVLPGTGSSVEFSPDGNYLAVGHAGAPRFTLLSHSSGFSSYSSSYSLSAGLVGAPSDVAFSPDGNYIAIAHDVTPRFTLLYHSGGSVSYASKYALPSGLGIIGRGVAFSPDGNYIAVTHDGAPYFTLLHNSAGSVTFASNYVLPNSGRGVAFSPDGNYIAIGHAGAPCFTLLSHSAGSVAFASNYVIPNTANDVAFSPDGNYIAIGHDGAPYFTLLHNSAGSVTFASNYVVSGGGFFPGGTSVSFSKDGNYLSVGHTGTPYFTLLSQNAGLVSYVSTYSLPGTANGISTI